MQYSKDLATVGGRLAYMFNECQYDLDKGGLRQAIKEMYKRGDILDYSPIEIDKTDSKKTAALKESDSHEKDIDFTYNQIRLHLNNAREVSTKWVIRYARFFNCSADYILGISDQALKDCGLNDIAIKNLYTLTHYALRDSEKETLNNLFVVNRGLTFRFIIRCIDNFINAAYYIPAYHKILKKGKGYTFNQLVIPDHKDDVLIDDDGSKKYLLTLLNSEDLLNADYLQYVLDESFIEDVSLKDLDKNVVDFKRQLKRHLAKMKKDDK